MKCMLQLYTFVTLYFTSDVMPLILHFALLNCTCLILASYRLEYQDPTKSNTHHTKIRKLYIHTENSCSSGSQSYYLCHWYFRFSIINSIVFYKIPESFTLVALFQILFALNSILNLLSKRVLSFTAVVSSFSVILFSDSLRVYWL